MSPRRPDRRGWRTSHERGSGLLSSVFGVACVAAILGVSVNICLGLWTRSTVDAVAYDAARDIATTPAGTDRHAAAAATVRRAVAQLGSYGDRVSLEVESIDGEVVVLRLRAPGLGLLPAMVDGGPMVGGVDRRIVVRNEVS